MAATGKGTKIYQEKTGMQAFGTGGKQLIYYDPTNGNNGYTGLSPREPVATFAQAVALADAGDTIIALGSGTETVTAGVTLSDSGVKVISPLGLQNPGRGVTISGAGTLDLLTISGTDDVVEGLNFKHTGATANQSGVLISATGSRSVVRKCVFNDTEITTTKTGSAVEVTSGADDVYVEECTTLDTIYGVNVAASGTNESDRLVVKSCTFYVGLTAGFGIYAPQATGKLQAPQIRDCLFIEADGDGSSATAAWDGSDGTNATQGPIKFGAAVDQYLVTGCRAYTALAQAFDTLNAINAGAAGDVADCATGTGSDTSAAVTSVGTLVSSALSATQSYGTAGSTAHSSSLSMATKASTGASSALSAIQSYGTAGSTANSSGLSATVSYGTAGSTANSSCLSATVSYGVAGSTAHSSSLSMATKASTGASSALSAVQSYATVGSTADSSSLSAVVSYGTAGSTANSSCLSATVSYGTAGSTANSSCLSATVSYGVAGSTANSSGLSATVSLGVVAAAVGKPISKVGSMADTAIDNNTQSAGCLMATAAGDVWIEDVALAKDGTALTGPTNVEITCDNVYGLTGTNAPHALKAIGLLQANENIVASGAGGTVLQPFVLESGKKLYLHGDDLAGTSLGAVRYAVIGRALSAGGSLS